MISKSFFRNRVARRIFLLFIISTLIPILILASLSLRQVNILTTEQVTSRLKQDAKFYGLSIYDHLLVIEEQLSFFGSMLKSGQGDPILHHSEYGPISGLSLLQNGAIKSHYFGRSHQPPSFSDTEWIHMREGKSVVSMIQQEYAKPVIFISRLIDVDSENRGIITALINQDYLWGDADLFNNKTSACIFGLSFSYLHCSNNPGNPFQEMIADSKHFTSTSVNTILDSEDNLSGSWRLFLQARFSQSEWKIILLQNSTDAFSQLKFFSGIYASVVLLAILIVSLFSIYLIRRNMVPLEALMTGIRKMSDNQYDTQVSLHSADEFEEVADAFNTMTSRIGSQIDRLTAQAEIDHLILSRPSVDDIVNIAFNGIERLTSCSWMGMAIMQDEQSHTFQLKGRNRGEDHARVINDLILSKMEIQTALSLESIVVDDQDDQFAPSLRHYPTAESKSYLILPITNMDGLIALLILGYISNPPSKDAEQSREFSNRIAVAFSNASWEEKLYTQAHFDPLTSLPNRMLLEDRLDQEISHAARNDTYLAVLFLDLDRFKIINDSLGHEFGDSLLKVMAKRMCKCLRQEDTVARLGGDEFVILIRGLVSPERALTTATSIAEKVIAEVSKPVTLEEHDIHITTSIGIAICPTDGNNTDTLLRNADTAMYHAKDLGRGNFQFYSEKLNAAAKNRLNMESRLHKALDEDEFEFHYQAKVDPVTGIIVGGEALIRWIDQDEGTIYPNRFITIADEIGLTTRIGKWGLEQACIQAKQWSSQLSRPFRISVNISAHYFHHGNLLKHVQNALRNAELEAACLEIEITESTAMYDMERTILILTQLRDLGVFISIDDFGTGYSSLTYLKYFPVYALKIDRSFIMQIPYSEKDTAIVKSTISLAHNLGLKVVAEGVETREQLNVLTSMGCDEIQGYIYSSPVKTEQFTELLSKGPFVLTETTAKQENGSTSH